VLALADGAPDAGPLVDPERTHLLARLFELAPDDDQGIRAAVIASFRNRGIYPCDAASLSQDSVLWPRDDSGLALPDPLVQDILFNLALGLWGGEEARTPAPKRDVARDRRTNIFKGLHAFARSNAPALGLAPVRPGEKRAPIRIDSYHPCWRVGQDGRMVFELFVNYVQTVRATDGPSEDFGGIPVRAGCTLIAAADGRVRYVIAKRFEGSSARLEQSPRALAQRDFVADLDARDPLTPYRSDASRGLRMKARASLSALHGRVAR